MHRVGEESYSPRRTKHAAGTIAGSILRYFYPSVASGIHWEYFEEPDFPEVNGHYRNKKEDVEDIQSKPQKLNSFVKVYPNPAQNLLHVQYSTGEAEVYIRITDLLGREMMQIKTIGGNNTESIATQNWSNGTYIYEVKGLYGRIGSGVFMISK